MDAAKRATLMAVLGLTAAPLCAFAALPGWEEDESDLPVGSARAPLTLIEYASVTCPHCKTFHDEIFPVLERDYIRTGKLRFLFRELPAPAGLANLAAASFQVARCAGANPEQYLRRISLLFAAQPRLFEAVQAGKALEALRAVATEAGLSEAEFQGCITDDAGYRRIGSTMQRAFDRYGVDATPTLILNGEKLPLEDAASLERLVQRLDARLARP